MKKEKAMANLMATFEKNQGGTKVDPELTTKDAKALRAELQKSFESIFPELIKPTKHRKHVIFDADVFTIFETLAGDSGSNFSALINSALRSYIQERLKRKSVK